MSPSFDDRETVFVFRWAYGFQMPFVNRYIVRWGRIKNGEIIVLKEPETRLRVLKRCVEVRDSSVYVLGDNLEKSRDSRHYGFVDYMNIEGRVLHKE